MDAITFNSLTNTHEAAYAIRPAWHNKGEVLDYVPNSAEMIRAANLADWNVKLFPLQTGSGIVVPNVYATIRQDTNQVLGTVGARYKVFQNEEAFGFLDGLLADGIMKYESAFSMFDSTRVVVVAKLPSVDTIRDDDTINRYILFQTSHDGSCAITATPTSIRPVCYNTVSLALRDGKTATRSVRHTENSGERLEVVKDYLRGFDQQFQTYADNAKMLVNKKYTKDLFTSYVQKLFPIPGVDASTRAKNIYAETRENLVESYRHPTNNLPSMVGTMWQMYNVITYSVDHLSNGHRSEDTNLDSLLFGKKNELKQRAFDLAVELAQSV